MSRHSPLRGILAATGILLGTAERASAFDLIGFSWPEGSIVMHLQLGPSSTVLLDGSPDWGTVAESALQEWNQHLVRSTLTVVRDSNASVTRSNRINNVVFRSDIYGQAFGTRTVAVTLGTNSGATGRPIERDVIFNSGRTWNSYRGNLRNGLTEFRRVALHEFGHVLGLDHPDEATPTQSVSAVMNSTISNVELLQSDDIAGARSLYNPGGPGGPPAIAAHPQTRTLQVGDSYTYAVLVNGTGPFTYNWTFRAAGSATTESLRLATGPSYTIGSVQTADAGTYAVTVAGGTGSVVSNTAVLTVLPVATSDATTLANISTRGVVSGGSAALIAGVVIGGTTPKNVLVRAIGPSLANFGVTGVLGDPVLELFDQQGRQVARNDNWDREGSGAAIAAASTRLGAFQLPSASADAAVIVTLPPGNYTVVVSDAGGETGVALVEAYDADPDAATARTRKLVNIATRGLVGAGDDVLIAGLVVTGPGPRTYLIRAAGPTLAATPFNVSGVLADPYLQLYRDEVLLRENDDWDAPLSAQPALRTAATRVGAFPLQNRRESAMLVTLQPGNYTAKVSGFESGTGVSLVEIYEVP